MTDSSTEGRDAASIEDLQLEVLKLAAIAAALMVRLGLDHTHVTRQEMQSSGMHGKHLACQLLDENTFCLQISGQETQPPGAPVH